MLDKKDKFINDVKQSRKLIASALDKVKSDILMTPSDYNEGLEYGLNYAFELLNIDFEEFEK